jgi:hypothetical protein
LVQPARAAGPGSQYGFPYPDIILEKEKDDLDLVDMGVGAPGIFYKN